MKRISLILTLILLSFASTSFAQLDKLKKLNQNDPEVVENIKSVEVWQIVESALREKGYILGEVKLEENIIYSDWIEWTSLAIKKRARIGFKYEEPILNILIMDRQYSSAEGWSEAMGKLAKATRKLYMQDVAEAVLKIRDDSEKVKEAILNSVIFPVFNPLHQVGNFQWTLCKTFRNEKSEVYFDFELINQGEKLTNLNAGMFDLYVALQGKSASGRGNVKWEKYVDNPKQTQFQPGDTIKMQAKVPNTYNWTDPTVPMLIIKGIYNDGKEVINNLKIYHIPIPYTNPNRQLDE